MVLYSHVRSPWCRKVEWALGEMKLNEMVKTTVIGLNADAQQGVSEMKAACGAHATMPALKVDNFVLCESSAILFFLADELKFDGDFFPKNYKSRAIIHEWDRIADINMGANILSPWLRNTLFLNGKDPDLSVFEKAKENFSKLEDRLDAQLSNTKWLGGDHFSYADVGMAHLSAQLKGVDGPCFTKINTQKWLDACTSRPVYVSLRDRNSSQG